MEIRLLNTALNHFSKGHIITHGKNKQKGIVTEIDGSKNFMGYYTFTVKPLSKWWIIRKLQILKFKITSK